MDDAAVEPDARLPVGDSAVPDATAPDAFVPDAFVSDVMVRDAIEPDAIAPDVLSPDVITPPACSIEPFEPAPSTITVCGGTSLRNPATTMALSTAKPWDGAPQAGPEIAARVCALVVTPVDARWSYAASRAQMSAHARTIDGRWYDVSRSAAWGISTSQRSNPLSIDATGLITRGGYLGSSDNRFPSTNTVTASFAGHTATRNWHSWEHDFNAPSSVTGPSTARVCSPVQLGLSIWNAYGQYPEVPASRYQPFMRFTVSDPTIAAVSEDGLLVGLRPGTVEVSAVTRSMHCFDRSCSFATARRTLTVTITDGDADAGEPADAALEAGADTTAPDATENDAEPADVAWIDASADADARPEPADATPPDATSDAGYDASVDADAGPYDGGINTVYFCGGAVVLENPAGTREQFFARPWDDAPAAGTEIVPSLAEVRVVPDDGVWGYWSQRARMRSVARTVDGRWYDVTGSSRWNVTTDDRRFPYWIVNPGIVARGPFRPDSSLDTSRTFVSATFGSETGSARWNVSGHYFPRPVGFSSTESVVDPCVATRLTATMVVSDGTSYAIDARDLRTLFAITVSDTSVVAVSDTGLMVGLRAGTATVSLTTRVPYCNEDRECAYAEAMRPLRVTVRP